MNVTDHARGNSHFLSSGISYSDSMLRPSDIRPFICGTDCASSGAVDDRWLILYTGLFLKSLSNSAALSCRYNALACIDTMRSVMGSLCLTQWRRKTTVQITTAKPVITTQINAISIGKDRSCTLVLSTSCRATIHTNHLKVNASVCYGNSWFCLHFQPTIMHCLH